LLPWLRGEKPDPTRTVYWHLPHYRHKGPQSAMRDGQWKLIHNIEADTHELYDLAQDPGEAKDLASAQPERTKELAAKLDTHLTESGAQRMRPNPDYDPQKPRGPISDMGTFYPKQGGTFQQVKDREYPAWFQHAEAARQP
jgi:arylsulfatase A-like enzyme